MGRKWTWIRSRSYTTNSRSSLKLSIMLRLQAGLYGVRITADAKAFCLLQNVQTALGPTVLPIQCVHSFSGIKAALAWSWPHIWLVLMFMNEWTYISASSVCLFGVDGDIFPFTTTSNWGTRWRSWLRHCATSQKVAGSIPDGVMGIFHWYNPSGRTMALESTQPLT